MSKTLYSAQISVVIVRQIEIVTDDTVSWEKAEELARRKYREQYGEDGVIVSCELEVYNEEVPCQ